MNSDRIHFVIYKENPKNLHPAVTWDDDNGSLIPGWPNHLIWLDRGSYWSGRRASLIPFRRVYCCDIMGGLCSTCCHRNGSFRDSAKEMRGQDQKPFTEPSPGNVVAHTLAGLNSRRLHFQVFPFLYGICRVLKLAIRLLNLWIILNSLSEETLSTFVLINDILSLWRESFPKSWLN